MLKLRDEYEKIFEDIEGSNSDTKLEWPAFLNKPQVLCYPRFVSKREQRSSLKNQAQSLLKPNITQPSRNEQDERLIFNHANGEEFVTKSKFDSDLDDEKIRFLQLDNLKNMSKNELLSIRESISLELLWIQQAIQSRVQV